MQKYGQVDKQKEIDDEQRRQAALLKNLPEANLAAQEKEDDKSDARPV
jgi:hypothetical protein